MRLQLPHPILKNIFQRRAIVTGYPLRSELAAWNKEKACTTLNLDDNSPVLLVFGGSKGARLIK